jgi:pimeloyl-ACP methyl ester carboxylesterase
MAGLSMNRWRFLGLALLLIPVLPGSALAAPPRSIVDAPIRTVEAGKGTVGYRSIGEGPPLVMIMGLSGSMDAWQPSFVDALAARRRVIVFDNEGIRRSSAGRGPLTIRRMAVRTAALIRALRLGRPDVLGWSMGGMIAQSLARQRPRLVRRLVLCATAPGNGKGTAPAAEVIADLADPATSQANLIAALFPTAPAAGDAFVRGIFAYPNASPAAPPEVVSAQFEATSAWLMGGDPTGRPLSRLRPPVLVGGGELDPILPVANQRHLGRRLPRAHLKIYPDAGHGFLFQHQRDWLRRMNRFLS